jgi:hypothetical protein
LIVGAGKIPLNMTVLGAYFKISSQGGRNPFERQKVWGKNKTKEGDEFKDPTVYFTMAVTTDEDPAEVMDRVRQEWGRIGGKMLRVKELQLFGSKTIISLFNISTQVLKKIILEEFRVILVAAQEEANEHEITDYEWDEWDLPRNSSIPVLELRLQNPKLPR